MDSVSGKDVFSICLYECFLANIRCDDGRAYPKESSCENCDPRFGIRVVRDSVGSARGRGFGESCFDRADIRDVSRSCFAYRAVSMDRASYGIQTRFRDIVRVSRSGAWAGSCSLGRFATDTLDTRSAIFYHRNSRIGGCVVTCTDVQYDFRAITRGE